MAESKETKSTNQQKIRIVSNGPTDEYSNSEVLRFQPNDKRKDRIDIRKGQILTVGEEITSEDANRLLNLKVWDFERVNN
jgi:hypothetical protein